MPGTGDQNLLLVLDTQRRGKGEIAAAGTELTGVTDASAKLTQQLNTLATASSNTVAKLGAVTEAAGVSAKATDSASAAATTASAAAETVVTANEATADSYKASSDAAAAAAGSVKDASEAVTTATEAQGVAAKNAAGSNDAHSESLKRVSPEARVASKELGILTLAFISGDTSAKGLAISGGLIVKALAEVSGSATLAASANGIGAIVIVVGTLIAAYHALADASQTASDLFVKDLAMRDDPHQIQKLMDDTRKMQTDALDKIQKDQGTSVADAVKEMHFNMTDGLTGTGDAVRDALGVSSQSIRQYQEATDRLEKLQVAYQAVQKAEVARVFSLNQQMKAQILQNDETLRATNIQLAAQKELTGFAGGTNIGDAKRDPQVETLRAQHDAALAALKVQYDLHKANGESIPLDDAQAARKAHLTDQINTQWHAQLQLLESVRAYNTIVQDNKNNTTQDTDYSAFGGAGDVAKESQDRINMINLEADAQEQAGIRTSVAQKTAQLAIRQLYLGTFSAAKQNLNDFTSVLLDSSNKQVRAVGHAFDSIRRVELGYEATLAGIKSIRYAAQAIGYAADLQWERAALATASSLQWAAVSAKAAQESLGGGTGASGGGGGGASGGGGSSGTFTPNANATSGGSNLTVQIVTRNPYGRDEIKQTMYELDRANLLNRVGTNIPPTTGIASVNQVA